MFSALAQFERRLTDQGRAGCRTGTRSLWWTARLEFEEVKVRAAKKLSGDKSITDRRHLQDTQHLTVNVLPVFPVHIQGSLKFLDNQLA